MKSSITTPIQSISTLTFCPRTEQRSPKFVDNPERTEEETNERITQKFQHADSKTDNEANDYGVQTNKNTHDYVSLMVNDYFIKLAYL